MSKIPQDLRYSPSHEWVKVDDDMAMVGITDHAQAQLGDLVFVELPEVGRNLEANEEFGVVESVKAASDLYTPVAGEVVEVNEAVADTPETINNDPYGDGWLVKIRLQDPGALDSLLDASAYNDVAAEED